MKTAVVVFPGSNCDRDMQVALRQATGQEPVMLWHKDSTIPAGVDLIALPGGFSFGDYLRCGAIASRSPIMRAVADFAGKGGFVLGVCNGFQVLVETGLLPGVLMRNATLNFVCRPVALTVEARKNGEQLRIQVQGVQPIDDAVADAAATSLKVFIADPGAFSSIHARLSRSDVPRGSGPVTVVMDLEDEDCDVEMRLPGSYDLSPRVRAALKDAPGVIEVIEV